MKQRSTAIARGRLDGELGDANQKRRRFRGGRARRIWQSWALDNPKAAVGALIFVSFCLIGMSVEQFGSRPSSSLDFRQRMRRARALMKQAAHRKGQDDFGVKPEEAADDDGEGDDDGEEEEEEEGDDRRPRGRPVAPAQRFPRQFDMRPREQQQQQQQWPPPRREEEGGEGHRKRYRNKDLEKMLDQLDHDVMNNIDGGVRWGAPYLMLPPLSNLANGRQLQSQNDDEEMTRGKRRTDAVNPKQVDTKSNFFVTKRKYQAGMKWEEEYNSLKPDDMKPPVDYVTHAYEYPPVPKELPSVKGGPNGEYPAYPQLQTMGEMMKNWPQDQDFPGAHERPIKESLIRFNFSNPAELAMAEQFRDAELPFKLYDVPEVSAATQKWTDEYVAENFDGAGFFRGRKHGEKASALMDRLMGKTPDHGHGHHNKDYTRPPPRANGQCQESANNFFAFFQPNLWEVKTMGLPPVRTNDWSFEHWAEHARYADAVALNASKPHFYWQSGVPREERHQPPDDWGFISRDLPSFSSPTKTFFVFNPESQKGIQCRFGERGVVAATHYDSGRNMIAMVTGAKRYILAPPKECPKLGIVPWKFNSIFRHSLLNFGHINYMNDTSAELDDGEEEAGHHGGPSEPRRERRRAPPQKWKGDHMSRVEREWMEIASSSKALETVLKAGEVLYLPSHWFHYIVSIQKSAQCNVRSGVDNEGTPGFGGLIDVKTCGRLTPAEAGLRPVSPF
ncbi:expressed unknown protein [Seminavis robusta]|uniref:JmjC domain-containing protein n=1 Tax=Seminavis robusta TaxID=568900 RepID=A0A9N8E9V4_9STRA|nr:expressed unknown protein [Seminavis robusta]|eukprot:Sro707_g190540.1 n/a (731) ;mRNA; f:8607-10890